MWEPPALTDPEMREVQALVYRQAGIRVADGKRLFVQHRLARRLVAREVHTYRDYCALIQNPAETKELQRFINALTTNETFFFRHKHHWDFLTERIFPAWSSLRRSPRAWSAACSTGEEAYSLAILAHDLLPKATLAIDGTDINDTVLETAAKGIYGEYALQKATAACRERHFRACGPQQWTVLPHVRALVQFRQANLLVPTRGSSYDLVLLRNVLIYFDEDAKAKVLTHIASRMAPEGWLFLGGAEHFGPRQELLQYVAPGIYRKPAHG